MSVEPIDYTGCTTRVTPDDVRQCCALIGAIGEPDPPVDDATLELRIAEALYLFDLATDFTFRGACQTQIRPVLHADRHCEMGSPSGVWAGSIDGYAMVLGLGMPFVLVDWGSWRDPLGRVFPNAIRLPFLPVRAIDAITVDAVALPGTAWRWIPGTNIVMRIDGARWPEQNLELAAGQPGTWSVLFTHGYDLPPGVDRRVAGVACELARACIGAPCQLPEGVRVHEKDGQTFVQFDDYRSHGLTGFPVLDDWIMAWRGGRSRIRPSMSRPRQPRGSSVRETSWPAT